ncbi:MAG: hypothetical protein GWN58_37775 [Anaerolineae bacterium]|nr:hypothetical protein [Anaerolineae bacterium]
MAWKRVRNYRLGYSLQKKCFYIYYELEGESSVHQFFPTPEEFVGLSDMFRNEGPINFNTDHRYFVTGTEEVGEEESDP